MLRFNGRQHDRKDVHEVRKLWISLEAETQGLFLREQIRANELNTRREIPYFRAPCIILHIPDCVESTY